MTCLPCWYTSAATGCPLIESTRPPTKRNPRLLKSATLGENVSLPVNQGFTVWWADDGPTTGWGAMRGRGGAAPRPAAGPLSAFDAVPPPASRAQGIDATATSDAAIAA